MDLSAIKAKLEALNQENQNSGVDNSKNFWKPDFGKTVIRIVPSAFDKDNPFTELRFHSNKDMVKYPILALSNMGKQDPVEDFILKLRETHDKENWSLSGKLEPKTRYFVPVIVRGEEDKGVRLWNIGITIYKALLQLAADEEIGDFTDVTDGVDITVTKVKGDPYPETTIMPKRNNSPLSDNPKEVENWLKNQPKPVDCFRHYEYDYIKKLLESFLTGKPAVESNPVVEAGEKILAEEKKETPVTVPVQPEKPKPSVKTAPKSTAAKFDDLFGDEEDEKSEDKEDELPF